MSSEDVNDVNHAFYDKVWILNTFTPFVIRCGCHSQNGFTTYDKRCDFIMGWGMMIMWVMIMRVVRWCSSGQILRLGYCNDLPNSQMFGRILDRSFSLLFSKSQCQHLFKTYERSKYQWAIKIPMSDQNTNRCSPPRFITPTAYKYNSNKKKWSE